MNTSTPGGRLALSLEASFLTQRLATETWSTLVHSLLLRNFHRIQHKLNIYLQDRHIDQALLDPWSYRYPIPKLTEKIMRNTIIVRNSAGEHSKLIGLIQEERYRLMIASGTPEGIHIAGFWSFRR